MSPRAPRIWPQVRPYAEPGRAPRAQWPAGIAIATLSAQALRSACRSGNLCSSDHGAHAPAPARA